MAFPSNILWVDDQPYSALAPIARCQRGNGVLEQILANTVWALDREEALRKAHERPYDLIVLDGDFPTCMDAECRDFWESYLPEATSMVIEGGVPLAPSDGHRHGEVWNVVPHLPQEVPAVIFSASRAVGYENLGRERPLPYFNKYHGKEELLVNFARLHKTECGAFDELCQQMRADGWSNSEDSGSDLEERRRVLHRRGARLLDPERLVLGDAESLCASYFL